MIQFERDHISNRQQAEVAISIIENIETYGIQIVAEFIATLIPLARSIVKLSAEEREALRFIIQTKLKMNRYSEYVSKRQFQSPIPCLMSLTRCKFQNSLLIVLI